ncbi:MAG: YqeG family HAD IIIA-type phosphatase [Clostridia bacterium]|nr:YqeG family HAD IIIA-type phosphatase [Clostridia bacterium]
MARKELPKATRVFRHFSEITPEILSEYGIKGIMTDLDDTLVEHNYPTPKEDVLLWLESIEKAGIPICIVSNNRRRRVLSFIKSLNLGIFHNSMKPSPRPIYKAMEVMGITPEESVFVGDQLFTDIKGANNAGIKSFLVDPIGNKATLFIRFKRRLEKRTRKG